MIDSVDQSGELTRTKSKWVLYGRNSKTIDNWLIVLPKKEKYLKYGHVRKTVHKIKICRKIMTYSAPIMIVCGFILLMTIEQ